MAKSKGINAPKRTPEEWQNLHFEWERSGLSEKEFCRTRKINYKSFSNSRKALKEKGYDIPKSTHKPRQTDERWYEIITEARESIFSDKLFCKKNGITLVSFRKAMERLKNKGYTFPDAKRIGRKKNC